MKKSPKGTFWQQKYHAKTRGIPFLFSYKEWVRWWETNLGSNWLELRGRRRGQYVMSRHGDTGPYVAWNVKCVTSEMNCIERLKIGKPLIFSKLNETQVLEIFNSNESRDVLAAKYNITKAHIYCIKAGRKWKYLTKK